MKILIKTILILVIFCFPIFDSKKSRGLFSENLLVSFQKREAECIRQALYYEAGGESLQGIQAVLSVIHNRKESRVYPDSWCGVIEQDRQFSYLHERIAQGKTLNVQEGSKKVKLINFLTWQAMQGTFRPVLPRSVMWYHTDRVKPKWSTRLTLHSKIGRHLFYAVPRKTK